MRHFLTYLSLLFSFTAGAQVIDTLQLSSRGEGKPSIVITGQWYSGNKKFAADAKAAADAIFSMVPLTEYRNCFNIFLLSPSDYACILDGEMVVGKDDDFSMNARVKSAFPVIDGQVFYVILLNTDKCAASTLHEDWANGGSAFSYITLYGGTHSCVFRQTVIHEVCGHAIGKLADEYVCFDGTCPESEMLFWVNHSEGKGLNLSLSPGPGFSFEGALGYSSGVWRSTSSSIMSDTDTHGMTFNDVSVNALVYWLDRICR